MTRPDDSTPTTGVTRRELLAAFTATTAAVMLPLREAAAAEATIVRQMERAAPVPRALKVYTEHEFATVRMLVDYLFPKDAKGPAASEAGAPEWMDVMLDIDPAMQTNHRGGLAWLDHECGRRFDGKAFIACTDAERRQVLDDIAWPRRATPAFAVGTTWFTSLRDFAATAYWSSEAGVADLGYQGNLPHADWDGCPAENYRRLGVSRPE